MPTLQCTSLATITESARIFANKIFAENFGHICESYFYIYLEATSSQDQTCLQTTHVSAILGFNIPGFPRDCNVQLKKKRDVMQTTEKNLVTKDYSNLTSTMRHQWKSCFSAHPWGFKAFYKNVFFADICRQKAKSRSFLTPPLFGVIPNSQTSQIPDKIFTVEGNLSKERNKITQNILK